MGVEIKQQSPLLADNSRLSVIIPVFNEACSIAGVIETVFSTTIGRYKKEVIVIDDGSTDDTSNILHALNDKHPFVLISLSLNSGKGAAIRKGLSRASGDLVVIQDADNEYHPSDWKKMIELVDTGGIDVVYGSRFKGEGNRWISLSWLANRLLSSLASILFLRTITDVETCYKLFRRDLVDASQLTENRFGIEIELTAHLLRSGVRFQEVPIRYSARTKLQGKKIGWKDGVAASWAIIKYRFIKS